MDQGIKSVKKVHPRETANIVSLVTFFYAFALFKVGFRKDLDEEDLYEVLTTCKSKTLGDQLETQWELDRKKNQTPSLVRVLWRCFGKTYMVFGVVQLIMRTVHVIFVPEALGKLVSYFNPGQTQVTKEDAYFYAATVIILNVINFVYTQNYLIMLNEFGIRIRTAICSFVYRKALTMTEQSLSEISMGKIITLITKDIHAIELLVFFGNDIWIGFLQTAVICYLIYGKIGLAAFAGVGFFLIVLPLQIFLGRMSMGFRLKTNKKTDERLQLTREILSTIKTIKMYAWEKFFVNKITLSRKKEMNSIFKLFFLKIIIIIIGGLSGNIAFYLLIMTHVWMGNFLTAEIVYFVKSCFHKLRHLLSLMLPLGISFGAEFNATSIRLQSILYAEEAPISCPVEISTKEPLIVFDNVSLNIRGVEILKDVTLKIKKGLNVVVGHVGSGKTCFTKAILQEFKVDGHLMVYGSLSYASQEPWLFPSTIRHNILFGQKMNAERYRKVLEICALNQDLKSFPDGDNTLVGDNGVNLSKGQQARVNLARGVYKDADIYLLDDCLAALDGHVSDYIFKECFLDFLKDKLTVFVSNSDEYVESSDYIVTINNGEVESSENVKKRIFELVKNKELTYVNLVDKVDPETPARRIYKEQNKSGKVDFETYKKYVQFGGGYFIFGVIIVIFMGVQFVVSYTDKLVSNWVTIEQNLSNYQMLNLTNTSTFIETEAKRTSILNLYTIIICVSTCVALIKSLCFFSFNRRASIQLHKVMISKIVNAKMTFFDSHFIGNVLNRFSKDLSSIDEHLPFVMNECFDLMFIFMGIIFLVATVNAIFLVPAGIFFIIVYLMRFIYLRTGRSLQRLEASTRSPLLGHLNASLEGLITIRAFRAQGIVRDEFDRHQDLYTSVDYTLQNSMRALAFVLDGMCSMFIAIVILRFLVFQDDTTVGNVGLAITQAFHLTGLLQYGIRRWADFESQMTSVERVLQYTKVDQEPEKGKLHQNWPEKGKVTYDNVSLQYGDRKVLKNLNFTIQPNQKIGIVGRTGAGKSSVISTLFRLYDTSGAIKIDDVNTEELQLHFLRSNIALIPQDPVLISGTIRDNIDPLNKYPDADIWKILKIVNLQDVVTNLTDKIDINTSFSAGQKQLFCLARALIRKNRIVVLDEATANLDNETDSFIRNVIQENFASCTVIIIAHRLSSVMGTDVVMVVDDGEIVEQDEPLKLLENKNSLFYEMIKQS